MSCQVRRSRRSPNTGSAREERADRLFEELFEIADKPCTNQVEVQQQRNRLDTRKWLASKLAPRKYGDRLEHDHKGGVNFQPAILVQTVGGPREQPDEPFSQPSLITPAERSATISLARPLESGPAQSLCL